MINFSIAQPYAEHIAENFLNDAAMAVFQIVGFDTSDKDLSIVVEGDDTLRTLNRDFRSIDHTTDVLSFPASELDPDSGHIYIGDIIISYPQAEKQALEAKHPVMDEIQLLVVHGVLHLLGYDHGDDKEKEIMWKIQTLAMESIKSSSLSNE